LLIAAQNIRTAATLNLRQRDFPSLKNDIPLSYPHGCPRACEITPGLSAARSCGTSAPSVSSQMPATKPSPMAVDKVRPPAPMIPISPPLSAIGMAGGGV
jgi:hypothetical protein